MLVYVLISTYGNVVDDWQSIEDIFAKEEDAEGAKLALEKECSNPDRQSWHIETRGVK
jgi:hypothetical protein